mgnify:CR=1 FL=1
MTEKLCQSLFTNFENAFKLLEDTILQFTPGQWLRGEDAFQVPAKISYHILDALDYYFRPEPNEKYTWGHRFGGGWWELPEEELPSPHDLLTYLQELEGRAQRTFFHDLTDADLSEPFDKAKEHGETRLGHFIYALRHTMHHHGALSLLSLQFANPEGIWL